MTYYRPHARPRPSSSSLVPGIKRPENEDEEEGRGRKIANGLVIISYRIYGTEHLVKY